MIELSKAIYCWDQQTGNADVVSFPMSPNQHRFWSTAGAVFSYWKTLKPAERRTMLLVEAWQSVVRDGVDPKQAHRALLKVEGMADMFAQDCQLGSVL